MEFTYLERAAGAPWLQAGSLYHEPIQPAVWRLLCLALILDCIGERLSEVWTMHKSCAMCMVLRAAYIGL